MTVNIFHVKALLYANRDTTVKGLIIQGQGKHFSLGLDLDYLNTMNEEYLEQFQTKTSELFWRLSIFPIPTVAAVNGKLSTCLHGTKFTDKLRYLFHYHCHRVITFEPVHEISNNVVCATSKTSDQPAHTRSLIRAFASRLSIL